jgi:LmbE family N-acetylglucosaminyl deacetylase
MRWINVRILTVIIAFLSMPILGQSQDKLKVIVIFAHPDEGEIYAGGITALYTQSGHEVKFMSLTNGDAGHYSMEPEELAKRRYKEAMHAKKILSLSEYEVLDYHDGILKNTEELRKKVASSIRDWEADIVFTFYPARGGHNDNMTAGWIVREASSLLDKEQMPVFIYMRDFHTVSFSYIPDFAINIDEVWETKLAACGAHESQVIEYNPEMEGVLDEVSASKEIQADFLFHNTIPFSLVRPDNLLALEKWYGKEEAKEVTYVEEFEIAEYGQQITDEDVFELFPMMSKVHKVSARADWFDTGIELREGHVINIGANGHILWNLKDKKYCDPDGAVPYTRWGNKPLQGAGTGALIGRIGEDGTECFLIGKKSSIHAYKSGRLYLGINDDNTQDNEGLYTVRIQVIK